MNKTLKFVCLGAFALTGIGFTACSSSEEAEVNPNYNPVTKEVNADFVFNVSSGNTPTSRQSAAITQATTAQVFRGITDAQLFAYKLGTSNDGKTVATATTANKKYALGTILSANTLDPDGDGASMPKSRRVVELALPVETNALMFWGKAPKTSEEHAAYGKITFNASNADISQHAFSLQPILTDGTTFYHYEQLLMAALNELSNKSLSAAAGTLTWTTANGGDGTTNASDITLKWSDYVTKSGNTFTPAEKSPINNTDDLSPLGEILADAFIELHTIHSGEVRAGSASAIRYMFHDLQNVIKKVADATPTNYREYACKRFATELMASIRHLIDTNGEFNATTTIKTNYNLTALTDVDVDDLNKFPATLFGLPQGGTQLTCSVDDSKNVTWTYTTNPVGPGPNTNTTFDHTHCMYPAELCYFGNSPVHVTDQVRTIAQYPDGSGTGTNEWLNNSSWDGWDMNKHVKSTSRSIAMAQNINYGTALLKTTTQFGANTLLDNNKDIQQERHGTTEDDKSIPVTAGMFQLKGILVGGQPNTVGWNYLAKGTPTWNYVIYDNQIQSPQVPADLSVSGPTYTLVWDNYNSDLGDTKQQTVYVALEFENNAEDFWGNKNLIRKGGHFYLIGALNPQATGIGDISWPTTAQPYALPPYDTNGNTIQAVRVFIQDYMTSANFVIGENSLKSAYLTVPDLRSTQISLGLSVDLNWSTGINFGNVTLGD